MTLDAGKSTNAADKMKSVKATWDKARSGPEKDAGLKHYEAADKAHTAKTDADTHKSPDAVTEQRA
jgi:hypothetical protein